MRYEVDDDFGSTSVLEWGGGFVEVTIKAPQGTYNASFDREQFKEFRRAIGYVWSEIEAAS